MASVLGWLPHPPPAAVRVEALYPFVQLTKGLACSVLSALPLCLKDGGERLKTWSKLELSLFGVLQVMTRVRV